MKLPMAVASFCIGLVAPTVSAQTPPCRGSSTSTPTQPTRALPGPATFRKYPAHWLEGLWNGRAYWGPGEDFLTSPETAQLLVNKGYKVVPVGPLARPLLPQGAPEGALQGGLGLVGRVNFAANTFWAGALLIEGYFDYELARAEGCDVNSALNRAAYKKDPVGRCGDGTHPRFRSQFLHTFDDNSCVCDNTGLPPDENGQCGETLPQTQLCPDGTPAPDGDPSKCRVEDFCPDHPYDPSCYTPEEPPRPEPPDGGDRDPYRRICLGRCNGQYDECRRDYCEETGEGYLCPHFCYEDWLVCREMCGTGPGGGR